MSEDKKEDRDFLSGHEELLNSLNKKPPADPKPAEEQAKVPQEETDSISTEEPTETPVPEKEIPEPAEEPEPQDVPPEIKPVEEPEPTPAPQEVPVEKPVEVPPEEEAATKEEEPVTIQKPVAEIPPLVKEKPAKPPKPAPKKKPAPSPEKIKKQKHDALEKSEVKEVLKFFEKYLKPAAGAIIVICVVIIGFQLRKNIQASKNAKADAALMEANRAEDYQAILDKYGKTPSAPIALLGLAQEKFNAGQASEADALYGQFLKKYKKHDMVLQARFNQITCKEAMRQYGDAIILYGDFKDNHPESHLAPVALLGKARCLEAVDRYAEAKQVYEDIFTFYSETGWAQVAEANLEIVEAKLK